MRSNSKRAKLATILLYIIAGSSFLFSLNHLTNIYLISQFENGDDISMELFQTVTVYFNSSLLLYLLSYLLCAIFFILWLTRAYRNIQIARPKSKFSYPAWTAAVVWFVPVWNIFGPYTIATNLFNKTEDYLMSEDKMLRNPNYDTVKGTWWALWILSSIFIRTGSYYAGRDPLSISGNAGAFVGFVLSIACALLAIQMIKNYTKMETLMKELKVNDQSVSHIPSNEDLLDSGI